MDNEVRFNPNKGPAYPVEGKNKPTGAPSTGKDFKKILSKDQREEKDSKKKALKGVDDEEEEATDSSLQEEMAAQGQMKQPSSLFDLSMGTNKGKKEGKAAKTLLPASDQPQTEVVVETKDIPQPSKMATKAFVLGENTEKPQPAAAMNKPEAKSETSQSTLVSPFTLAAQESKKDKFNPQFAREQPDLTYINPMGTSSQATVAPVNFNMEATPVSQAKNIQELINQMVKEAQNLEVNGKSETTVVLKNPPIFEGANIVITSFDSAKGQFNISFENLKPEAQALLNMQQHRTDLIQSLEKKGYNVHILTTTTYDEHRIYAGQAEDPNQRQQRDQDERQQQQRRQQQEPEEEEAT